MNTSDQPLGARIKARRRSLGLSQQEVADQVHCHYQTIDKIERGRISWSRYHEPVQRVLGMMEGPPSPAGAQQPTSLPTRSPSNFDVPFYFSKPGDGGRMVIAPVSQGIISVPHDRPHELTDSYAIMVSTDDLSPAIQLGDRVVLAPLLPPETGKFVLCRASNGHAAIGMLEEVTHDKLSLVTRYLPREKREHLLRSEFPHCHRVVNIMKR